MHDCAYKKGMKNSKMKVSKKIMTKTKVRIKTTKETGYYGTSYMKNPLYYSTGIVTVGSKLSRR